jgi:phosphatidylserine/phosphatidylglycerophosphate/cardiolipin synthase-like enzyme
MNLIVQPEAGLGPVVRGIQRARHTVDIAIFRIDRKEIEKALGAAVQRGVRVRVLVAHTNRGGENRLRKLELRLLEAGATVARTGDAFVRYHGKFMVVDDMLHLFAFNLTRADTLKSRSFGVSTKDKRAVREAIALFEADTSRQPFVPKKTPLVVSPENARETLTAFIKGARRQLLIYDVNLQDPVLIKLLRQQVAAGVEVRVIGKFKGSGPIEVRPLRPMRLHARAIVRDGSRAFVGSQSLRRPELDQRREVGVLITNTTVARKLRDLFEADWAESAQTKAASDVVSLKPKAQAEDAEQEDTDDKARRSA